MNDARKLWIRNLVEKAEHRLDTATRRRKSRQAFLARIKECAEDGQVATVWSGRDCDCVQYECEVRCCEATPQAVEALADRVYEWADGPCGFYIERPSVASQLRYSSRDLAMEAYEDGHPHVIYA
jgi:hypothetical protein